MTQGWTFAGESAQVDTGVVTLVEGSSFCLSERSGDIVHGTPQGLFYRDTRILSVWQLLLDDEEADPLSVMSQEPYRAVFLGRARPRPGHTEATILVERRRFVGAGMREDVVLRNLGNEAAACVLTLRAEADFADLFEVKEGRIRLSARGRGRPQPGAMPQERPGPVPAGCHGGRLRGGVSTAGHHGTEAFGGIRR
ncbi:glycogen debranching N-terminal domain-containing protein [Streptomyces sp. NPDC059373]